MNLRKIGTLSFQLLDRYGSELHALTLQGCSPLECKLVTVTLIDGRQIDLTDPQETAEIYRAVFEGSEAIPQIQAIPGPRGALAPPRRWPARKTFHLPERWQIGITTLAEREMVEILDIVRDNLRNPEKIEATLRAYRVLLRRPERFLLDAFALAASLDAEVPVDLDPRLLTVDDLERSPEEWIARLLGGEPPLVESLSWYAFRQIEGVFVACELRDLGIAEECLKRWRSWEGERPLSLGIWRQSDRLFLKVRMRAAGSDELVREASRVIDLDTLEGHPALVYAGLRQIFLVLKQEGQPCAARAN